MNIRLIAARVIDEVTNGSSLSDCLDKALKPIKDPRDRALIQAICYGVCRYYARLDVILSLLFKKPMKAKDNDVHALLLVGLYQLMDMRVPPHAAVAETVAAADKLRKPWARGLINAILREYLRSKDKLEAEFAADPEALYAHPAWWIEMSQEAWPDQWQAILNANNAHPPLALRINQQHLSREEYLTKLTSADLSGKILSETQTGIVMKTPKTTEELPGFFAGDFSVQDGAAQLAGELLELAPQQHVLDACAAPGGKLTHLLEIEPTLTVVAVEKEAKRLAVIHENLNRLLSAEKKKQIKCVRADATEVNSWWDKKLFDRILLDAPCSASGVIRRHPDIKLLREPDDIEVLANEQSHLLESLWPLLKPGGILLYATCSIFPAENTQVMEQFLAAHPDAKEEKINAEWGIPCSVGRQILPGMHDMDGFYYARVRKV